MKLKKMNLTLVVAKNCKACLRAERLLKEFVNENPITVLKIKDIRENKFDKVFILPALFIDKELHSYGEVDINKLKHKLHLNKLDYS